ncbi:MAG: hypothetical protein WC775_04675 [Patescibacteria group bacterium]|jgi:hypothetical protein
MSDLKSVIAFFIGLVFFVVLVVFAIGRIRGGAKPTSVSASITATITQAPSPTPVGLQAAKKPSFIDRIKSFFTARKVTPTPTTPVPNPTAAVANGASNSPNFQLKDAVRPTVILYTQTKGGVKQPSVNTVSGVATIPETGAETFVLPLASALGGLGIYLKKRK